MSTLDWVLVGILGWLAVFVCVILPLGKEMKRHLAPPDDEPGGQDQ